MDAQAHFQVLARDNAGVTRQLFERAFNQGTHHRGQITAATTAMGRACPEIDLVWMLQAESAKP